MPNWGEVLEEIAGTARSHSELSNSAVDLVRRGHLKSLFTHTGRNVIAYYSGFLSKPGIEQSCITDEDKNGFMRAIHGLDRDKGLDFIIHTQGGGIAATESIVDYLHKMFGNNIRAIVPQIALSAGTMLACSCKTILMAKHSNLGPIDPQLKGIPAHGVIEEFKRAYEEIKETPSKIAVWQPILSKYYPTFLSQCENAIKWSSSFVLEQLKNVMFADEDGAEEKANIIVERLSNYQHNKTHERHIHTYTMKNAKT